MADTTLPGVLLPAAVHGSRPSATDVAPGSLFPCTTHKKAYQSDGATWTDWLDGSAGGTTGTAAPSLTLSTSNSAGSATTVVATDATIAAFDATVPTTSALADAAAAGSAGKAARRDHVHGRESFATPAIVLGTAAAAGSAATPIRSDATIVAFDATAPAAITKTAAAGSQAVAARRDHAHNTGLTTKGDLLVTDGTATNRLAVGTDAFVLTADAASTNGVKWAAASAGFSDPMTTRGDIIVRNAANATARLAIGSSGKVLSSDGTDVSWATPSGGSGATIQYPALKPGTPTYDFAGASLDVAFSAHSSQGSFGTGNCITQGIDWMGSSVELQFSAQMGVIYVTHANADFDFTWGGIRYTGLTGAAVMPGIAALDSAGTGVGIVAYTDANAYLATITTWNYSGNSDSWAGHGSGSQNTPQGDWWFRLKRVSGTWTGYASQSGRTWDKTFSTRADSITVDRLVFGTLYSTGSTYYGRLTADYCQVDV